MLLQRASFGFSMGSMNAFLLVGWGAALVPTFVWVKVRKISKYPKEIPEFLFRSLSLNFYLALDSSEV